MDNSAQKVLFVNSEIFPYLPENHISRIGRYLPQGIQEKKKEIRAFMPRYGCIGDRTHQLHEVIRLSGMNIIIDDVDRPLVIKVGSIAAARIQVYFIDNEDYFRRKHVYFDGKGKFFKDNGERAVFFARGVMETVKKLRWAPDIIHCHGWISHLLPLYLKKAYKDDPIFSQSKIVLSLYGDTPAEKFSKTFHQTALFGAIKPKDTLLAPDASGLDLARVAVRYSDGVILGSEDVHPDLARFAGRMDIPILNYDAASFEDGSYIDAYNAFYDKL